MTTPTRAATSIGERGTHTPTRVSGPAPSRCRRRAIRLARACSSAYVQASSSLHTAVASGVRTACASIQASSEAAAGSRHSRAVAFQPSTICARSSAVSSDTSRNSRAASAGSASMAAANCTSTRAMASARKRRRWNTRMACRDSPGLITRVTG